MNFTAPETLIIALLALAIGLFAASYYGPKLTRQVQTVEEPKVLQQSALAAFHAELALAKTLTDKRVQAQADEAQQNQNVATLAAQLAALAATLQPVLAAAPTAVKLDAAPDSVPKAA